MQKFIYIISTTRHVIATATRTPKGWHWEALNEYLALDTVFLDKSSPEVSRHILAQAALREWQNPNHPRLIKCDAPKIGGLVIELRAHIQPEGATPQC